jgi:hypothetical protein
MSSTFFEAEGSSSGRGLCVQLWYNLFTCKGTSSLPPTRLPVPLHVNNLYNTCTYDCLPEDEPSASKHVGDITKIKILQCRNKCEQQS